MSSKEKTLDTPTQGSSAFIPHVQTGAQDSDPRWPLPITDPILLFASTTSRQIIHGRILPRVHQARLTPGVNKVSRNGGAGDLIGLNSTWGRILVPVDIEIEAFGLRERGYNRRLETRRTNSAGGKEYFHCLIWQRPRLLGSLVVWDRDEEGYIKFLELLQDKYLGAPDPMIIRQLTDPILAEIRALEPKAVYDPSAKQKIEELKKLYNM